METVFEAFPDLGFRLNPEGTILSYYVGSQSLLYLTPEEFLGKRMQEVLPPDVGNRFGDALRLLPLPGEDIFAIIREVRCSLDLQKPAGE